MYTCNEVFNGCSNSVTYHLFVGSPAKSSSEEVDEENACVVLRSMTEDQCTAQVV